MVPPQPRLPIRRSPRWAVGLTVALAGLAAFAVLAFGQGPRLKGTVDWLRGTPAWLRRAALGPEDPAFNGLAASQVGYAPSMLKQFSSPKPFTSFQVMSATNEVTFQGGPPVREIATDALGAIRTVWVGDFTPLRAPGRYRIVTDAGTTSHPFNIGPDVFD